MVTLKRADILPLWINMRYKYEYKNKEPFQLGEQSKQKLKELAEKLKSEGKLKTPTSK